MAAPFTEPFTEPLETEVVVAGVVVAGVVVAVELTPPPMVFIDPFIVFADPLIVFTDPFIVFTDPFIVFADPFIVFTDPFIVFTAPFIVFTDPLGPDAPDSFITPFADFDVAPLIIPQKDSFPMLSLGTCKLVPVDAAELQSPTLFPSVESVGRESPEFSIDEHSLSGIWISFPSNDMESAPLGSNGSGSNTE